MPKLKYVGERTIDIVGLPGKTKKGDVIDQGHLFCANMLRAHPDEWEVVEKEDKALTEIREGAFADRAKREKEEKERLAAAKKATKKEDKNA